jgi:hypothetical protein
MRKLFLILALVLVASGAFAQSRIVTEYNGFDWSIWTSDQKLAIVTGYLVGIETYRKALVVAYARSKDPAAQEALSKIYDWGSITATVGQITQRIEQLYNSRTEDGKYGNRSYPILELIIYEFQMPWWIDKDGNVLNPDGTLKNKDEDKKDVAPTAPPSSKS